MNCVAVRAFELRLCRPHHEQKRFAVVAGTDRPTNYYYYYYYYYCYYYYSQADL